MKRTSISIRIILSLLLTLTLVIPFTAVVSADDVYDGTSVSAALSGSSFQAALTLLILRLTQRQESAISSPKISSGAATPLQPEPERPTGLPWLSRVLLTATDTTLPVFTYPEPPQREQLSFQQPSEPSRILP